MHNLKCKATGRKGHVALKLDISNAFNSFQWDYLREVLLKLGFAEVWVTWIMMCVSSIEYHVLVIHDRVGPITPPKGLRQGDPTSPYLYILCVEGLSTLIKKNESRGNFHGVRICRGFPSIIHLLFAYDSFIFCKATLQEVDCLKGILSSYEYAFGQAVNYSKSALFFGKNIDYSLCDSIANSLLVSATIGNRKYLGLLSLISRNKKSIFSFLKDRIWRKCQSWSAKSLSKAGKEILIKSVAQAIPSYCMSVFLLPTSLGEEIERMLNSFYWGSKKKGSRGINWLRWSKLTRSKNHGGLNFRNLEAFNLAMIGKQGWKLLSDPNSLLSRVLKARYFPRKGFLEVGLGHNPSFTWRSFWSSKPLIKLGYHWKIGNGRNINVWKDSWIRSTGEFKNSCVWNHSSNGCYMVKSA